MAVATPKTFKVTGGEAPLVIDKVELHRNFETDRDGRTSIHIWITAEATPADDAFQSLTADVSFVLSHDGDELGTCTHHAISFEKQETLKLSADNDLRIDAQANVTSILASIDVVRVVHATSELKLGPA